MRAGFIHHLLLIIPIAAGFLVCRVVSSQTETEDREHIEISLNKKIPDQQALCNDYTYYKVDFMEACKDLRIQVMDVTEGEPNLYVAKSPNKYPTYNSLAWSSYKWGGEDLVISSWDPEFTVGTYYIGVHAYCGEDVKTNNSDAKYALLVTSEPTSHPHTEIPVGGSRSGRLSADDYNYFRVCIPSSCANVEVRLENCIDSKACPTSYAWPELLVSRSIVEPRVNDHTWKLATIEQRSVFLNHDDLDFYPGHYFVGVYGWCTPDEHCPDIAKCGPCTYVQDHPYNVSVLVNDVTKGCVPKRPLELCAGSKTGERNRQSSVLLLCALLISSIVSLKFAY